MLAIVPDVELARRAAKLATYVRVRSPLIDPSIPVEFPGDREIAAASASGGTVEIDEPTRAAMQHTASKLGVALPAAFMSSSSVG